MDDGSTDNTENVINNYNDYRIVYIKTDNWGGPARPRNIGIKKSKGNYIAFCDDDDIWKNNKLEKQLSFFKMNKDLGICFTSYSIINNKDTDNLIVTANFFPPGKTRIFFSIVSYPI